MSVEHEDREDDDDDATLTYRALHGYANWIETGDFLLSAGDAAEQSRPRRVLGLDQMRLIVRLRDLATTVAQNRGAR